MTETSRILATPGAQRLIGQLRAEHGPLSLHISHSYGVTVTCLREHELKLGSSDLPFGSVCACPVYIMASIADYWSSGEIVLDVAPGIGLGFSLEGPTRSHFTLRKRIDPKSRIWDANDYLIDPTAPASHRNTGQ
jgi:hypothetical protein